MTVGGSSSWPPSWAWCSPSSASWGHDTGHQQVLRGTRGSTLIGLLVGNLAIGLGHGWWNDKHDAHHAHPNHEQLDPDIAPGALVFARGQAGARRGLGWFVTKWQAVLLLPMLLLEGLSLHLSGLRVVRGRDGAVRWTELSLLVAHLALYVGAVTWLLPWGMALAFMAVHQAVFGLYLGLSFAPNHKGMPLLTEADTHDHLPAQVLTARNVRPGRVVDAALGGLNYQIEHRLFPSMPRHNLPAAQPLGAGLLPEPRGQLPPDRAAALLRPGAVTPARGRRPAARPGRPAPQPDGAKSPAEHAAYGQRHLPADS